MLFSSIVIHTIFYFLLQKALLWELKALLREIKALVWEVKALYHMAIFFDNSEDKIKRHEQMKPKMEHSDILSPEEENTLKCALTFVVLKQGFNTRRRNKRGEDPPSGSSQEQHGPLHERSSSPTSQSISDMMVAHIRIC